MTQEFTITAVAPNGEEREKSIEGTRADAQAKVAELEGLGFTDVGIQSGAGQEAAHVAEDNAVVQQGGKADGGVQVVEEPTEADLPDEPSVSDDPVDWLPEHFIDTIQGTPTVNRKGFAVIASKYNVSVEAEPVTLPSDTDFEYAEFKAVATTEDGQEYTGFGSAHVDRQDGDDPYLLGELAETRAMKRATSWATGIGLTAIEEMKNTLDQ